MLIRTPVDLGAVIRDRRRLLELDQATLAKRIGVSRQWVVAIEKGRSRAELGLVLRALEAVGVRLDTSTDAVNKRRKDVGTPKVDIDAIVSSARKARR